jgi:hypothetical protein
MFIGYEDLSSFKNKLKIDFTAALLPTISYTKIFGSFFDSVNFCRLPVA